MGIGNIGAKQFWVLSDEPPDDINQIPSYPPIHTLHLAGEDSLVHVAVNRWTRKLGNSDYSRQIDEQVHINTVKTNAVLLENQSYSDAVAATIAEAVIRGADLPQELEDLAV